MVTAGGTIDKHSTNKLVPLEILFGLPMSKSWVDVRHRLGEPQLQVGPMDRAEWSDRLQ